MKKCPFRCMPNRKRHHWQRSIKSVLGHLVEFCIGCGCERITTTQLVGGVPDYSKKQTTVYLTPESPRTGWLP